MYGFFCCVLFNDNRLKVEYHQHIVRVDGHLNIDSDVKERKFRRVKG